MIAGMAKRLSVVAVAAILPALFVACAGSDNVEQEDGLAATAASDTTEPRSPDGHRYLQQPLVTDIYTADPSAHVFDGRIYIYASHDIPTDVPADDMGAHFQMRDYHVLSMGEIGGEVTVHPVALDVDEVPWASGQMWAPDAAYKDGTYYFYFPAKDSAGIFRMGVATGDRPEGPFQAEPEPIEGSFSMDPAVFVDDDGAAYMYFGGIWGGQLQCWTTGEYDPDCTRTDHQEADQPALMPKVARMTDDMLQFAEEPRDAMIVDEQGEPILGGDTERRFFEAAWLHKHEGRYYLSYSTGDTHYIVYGVSDSPYGPFTYEGRILEPVHGWTSHHSIAQVGDRWYLFYHDTQMSDETHLRNVKVTELVHEADGSIRTIDPFLR